MSGGDPSADDQSHDHGPSQQRYDHRLRELVHRTGDLTFATDLGVPRSTARERLRTAPTVVVSLEVADLCELELRQEVVRLRRRVQKLAALLRLALGPAACLRFTLSGERPRPRFRTGRGNRDLKLITRVIEDRVRHGTRVPAVPRHWTGRRGVTVANKRRRPLLAKDKGKNPRSEFPWRVRHIHSFLKAHRP